MLWIAFRKTTAQFPKQQVQAVEVLESLQTTLASTLGVSGHLPKQQSKGSRVNTFVYRFRTKPFSFRKLFLFSTFFETGLRLVGIFFVANLLEPRFQDQKLSAAQRQKALKFIEDQLSLRFHPQRGTTMYPFAPMLKKIASQPLSK